MKFKLTLLLIFLVVVWLVTFYLALDKVCAHGKHDFCGPKTISPLPTGITPWTASPSAFLSPSASPSEILTVTPISLSNTPISGPTNTPTPEPAATVTAGQSASVTVPTSAPDTGRAM